MLPHIVMIRYLITLLHIRYEIHDNIVMFRCLITLLLAWCGQIVESVLRLFAFYVVEKSAVDLFSWKTKMVKVEYE